MQRLSVWICLACQAAGGASRPETELGSWFLVNLEQQLRLFSSDVAYELFSNTNTAPLFLLLSAHGAHKTLPKKNKIYSTTFSFALTEKCEPERLVCVPTSLYTRQKSVSHF